MKERRGYCSSCRKVTQWIKHHDFKDIWICGTQGCYHRSKNPEKEKAPVSKDYYQEQRLPRNMLIPIKFS